jgi:hypothetical protein
LKQFLLRYFIICKKTKTASRLPLTCRFAASSPARGEDTLRGFALFFVETRYALHKNGKDKDTLRDYPSPAASRHPLPQGARTRFAIFHCFAVVVFASPLAGLQRDE